jgi:phospholipid-binding lipoprotein MlaA
MIEGEVEPNRRLPDKRASRHILANLESDNLMRRRSMTRMLRITTLGLLLFADLLLSACAASKHAEATGGFYDPFEKTNRKIFAFNQKVDRHVIVPAAKAYNKALPAPARDSIRDFFRNLNGLVIFANDTLQARFKDAGKTFARFTVNSTLGIAGFVDLAGRWGLPYHDNDFGVTLGVWGVGPGPYLVVPVLGPSDPRDLAGTAVDGYADPWSHTASDQGYVWTPILGSAIDGIDTRARNIKTLADLERTSLDYYAAIRALYLQRRAALIRHEKNLPPNPTLTLREVPAARTQPMPAPAVLFAARNGSEVSP